MAFQITKCLENSKVEWLDFSHWCMQKKCYADFYAYGSSFPICLQWLTFLRSWPLKDCKLSFHVISLHQIREKWSILCYGTGKMKEENRSTGKTIILNVNRSEKNGWEEREPHWYPLLLPTTPSELSFTSTLKAQGDDGKTWLTCQQIFLRKLACDLSRNSFEKAFLLDY